MAVAVAGAVGLGLLAVPRGAGAAPSLPPVTPQDLVASVLTAHPGGFAGTVEVDNALGIPALPMLPQLADGTSTARVWSSGDGKARISLPQGQDERTLVEDGSTLWLYDSAQRTVTKLIRPTATTPGTPRSTPDRAPAELSNPVTAAGTLIQALRQSSTLSVDGTDEVAGRPAYDLVLTPRPDERTLVREVRVAVDAQRRVPLQLSLLADGSPDPALRIGFTHLAFAGQDPSLFTFTPPPGATLTQPSREAAGTGQPPAARSGGPKVVGQGWDSVLVATLPARQPSTPRQGLDPLAVARRVGTPVSGPWGSGWLVSTKVASAIVTSDGRIAVGAVPEQVLAQALAR